MAPLIINNDAVQGETLLLGQIFVFGGFALRANSLGHLEQIESYAPGHQVRFGSLNYMADIRGDLIFDGFEPQPSVPHCLDGHDIDLPPNTKICLGRKVSPWTMLFLMIEGAIDPCSDDTEELSMKAPMSVSKPADLR